MLTLPPATLTASGRPALEPGEVERMLLDKVQLLVVVVTAGLQHQPLGPVCSRHCSQRAARSNQQLLDMSPPPCVPCSVACVALSITYPTSLVAAAAAAAASHAAVGPLHTHAPPCSPPTHPVVTPLTSLPLMPPTHAPSPLPHPPLNPMAPPPSHSFICPSLRWTWSLRGAAAHAAAHQQSATR
jgi:hypothetical protein